LREEGGEGVLKPIIEAAPRIHIHQNSDSIAIKTSKFTVGCRIFDQSMELTLSSFRATIELPLLIAAFGHSPLRSTLRHSRVIKRRATQR
jgi:carbon monoxide dehydrogenase subunit G